MATSAYTEFVASHRARRIPCKRIGDVPADEHFEVSMYLKPRDAAPCRSRADLAARAHAAQHAGRHHAAAQFRKRARTAR